MTKFANLSSWLAAVACGLCLALAVLATPTTALADEGGEPEPGFFTACSNCLPNSSYCSKPWRICWCTYPQQSCDPNGTGGCYCNG